METAPGIVDGPGLLAHCAPAMASLHAFWDAKCRGRTMPARGDFDAAELKPWFGRTGLLDVLQGALPDGPDFRYRLVGTAMAGDFDADLTGRCVSETSLTADIPAALANLRAVVANRRPRWRGDLVLCIDGRTLAGERLYLPLSDDGTTVNMILFHTTPPRRADGTPAPNARAQFWNMVG